VQLKESQVAGSWKKSGIGKVFLSLKFPISLHPPPLLKGPNGPPGDAITVGGRCSHDVLELREKEEDDDDDETVAKTEEEAEERETWRRT